MSDLVWVETCLALRVKSAYWGRGVNHCLHLPTLPSDFLVSLTISEWRGVAHYGLVTVLYFWSVFRVNRSHSTRDTLGVWRAIRKENPIFNALVHFTFLAGCDEILLLLSGLIRQILLDKLPVVVHGRRIGDWKLTFSNQSAASIWLAWAVLCRLIREGLGKQLSLFEVINPVEQFTVWL